MGLDADVYQVVKGRELFKEEGPFLSDPWEDELGNEIEGIHDLIYVERIFYFRKNYLLHDLLYTWVVQFNKTAVEEGRMALDDLPFDANILGFKSLPISEEILKHVESNLDYTAMSGDYSFNQYTATTDFIEVCRTLIEKDALIYYWCSY